MHCKRYQGSMREDRIFGVEETQDSMGMKNWHQGGARTPTRRDSVLVRTNRSVSDNGDPSARR